MNRSHTTCNHLGEIIETIIFDVEWSELRISRNNSLTNSDWRFMSDQTPSQEWIDYRVFLRDLPQNFPDSANAAADAWNEYILPEGA